MSLPEKQFVLKALTARGLDILMRNAVLDAWDEVQQYEGLQWYRRKSTCRHLMWEHTIKQLEKAVAGVLDVQLVPCNDTINIIVGGLVLCRFKKADRYLNTHNLPTQMSLAFTCHVQLELPYPVGIQRVEIVHTLNDSETVIERVCIVAKSRGRVIWEYDLLDAEGSTLPLPIEPPALPPKRPISDLVKPRRDRDPEREASNEEERKGRFGK